jgi:hypothetical protein
VPWIAYGWDEPDEFRYVDRAAVLSAGYTLEAFHEAAMASLAAEPFELSWIERPAPGSPPIRIASLSGGYFTAVKVLDSDLMRRLEKEIGTRSLAVAIPYRPVLFAMDARALAAHPHGPVFLDLAGKWWDRALASGVAEDALTQSVFLTADGEIAGYAARLPRPSN